MKRNGCLLVWWPKEKQDVTFLCSYFLSRILFACYVCTGTWTIKHLSMKPITSNVLTYVLPNLTLPMNWNESWNESWVWKFWKYTNSVTHCKRKVWISNSITACLSSQKMSKPLGQLHPIAPKRHWILQCLCDRSKLHNWSIKVQFSFVFFQCTTTPLTFLHLKPLHLRIICNSKIFFIILKAYIKLE